ncbi:hypothetical protein ACA30_22690 [Virgibacillus soli]|nr:hypothetical protein ACA30_22690 [Virgibacillus soli]
MFDTVKIAVPLMLSRQEIENVDWNETVSSRRLEANKTIFKKLYDSDHKGLPFIRYTYKEDEPSKCWLKVETSIPSFIYGSNVNELQDDDIDTFFIMMRKYISVKLKINLSRVPSIRTWVTEKVHVCKNFNVGHLKSRYLNAISARSIAKYQKRTFNAKGSDRVESVEWKATKKKEKIYDKEAEVEQQRQYPDKARHLKRAKGILRYEIELSDTEIRKISPGRKAVEVLNMDAAAKILQKGLDRNGLSSGVKYTSLQQVIDAINQETIPLRTKSSLIAFATELLFSGEDECLNKYAASTFRKRKRQLRGILGTDVLLIGDSMLPPLRVLPQKKTATALI